MRIFQQNLFLLENASTCQTSQQFAKRKKTVWGKSLVLQDLYGIFLLLKKKKFHS